MAIRLAITISGMILGAGMIGIALHDRVRQTFQVLAGKPITK